jgi:DNA-binding response OmpR family regulator
MSISCEPVILVVDNDDHLRSALCARLAMHGYRCLSASTGAQAMALFREHEVRMVITDLSMPLGDGVALANEIRRTSDVPIVIITGYREAYRRTLRSVMNVTTLEKPFDPAVLLALVEASTMTKIE